MGTKTGMPGNGIRTSRRGVISTRLYESIMDGITSGVWVADKKDVIYYANKAMEMIAGVTQQKLIGSKVFPDQTEEETKHFKLHYREAKETLRPVYYSEVPVVTPAGRQTYQSGWLIPKTQKGSYDGMICTVEDITNEKQAKKALWESETKYRQLVESANSIILRMDAGGAVTFCNSFALKFFGYGADEIIGKNIVGSIVPETGGNRRTIRAMLRNIGRFPGRYAAVEYENVRKNGEKVWISWANKALFDDDGAMTEILCIGNDITVQKYHEHLLKKCRNDLEEKVRLRTSQLTRANEELQLEIHEREWMEQTFRSSEEKYRLVVEYANEGIVINQGGFFQYVNPKAVKILGYPKEELTSRPFIDFIHPGDRERMMERYLKRIKGDSVPNFFSCRIVDREGNTKWVEINSVLITWMGRPATLAFFNNITERKRAEEQFRTYQEQLRLLASELLLTEERERRRIATDIHDHIGQTLALIKIQLGALKDALSGNRHTDAVDDVRALIEQTIQYTKSLTFELSPPILYDLGLEATIEWLAERMQKQHYILFTCENDGSPKPLTRDVSILLFQAVRELFMNIVKHAQAHQVTVSVTREDDSMKIAIEDDGVGFDSATIDKGMTFGFFSIRERLKYLGGSLAIDTAPGRGTRVTLTSPLALERSGERSRT